MISPIKSEYIKMFSHISAIDPEAESTWRAKIFLSFDVDWAHDQVIEDTIKIVKSAGVESTWFVTHDTPLIQKIQDISGGTEVGIHPNFNPLLDGACINPGDGAEKVLGDLLSLVPGPRAIRSHSLTQSERLVDQFRVAGLTHISNCFLPYGCGIDAKPFSIWNDTVIVPHCWQDNVALKMHLPFPSDVELHSGFHVFDFHPIHVFLNTENLDRYERTRHLHQRPAELIKHRYDGEGTRTRLLALLRLAS